MEVGTISETEPSIRDEIKAEPSDSAYGYVQTTTCNGFKDNLMN
jgi:hypothetical protein